MYPRCMSTATLPRKTTFRAITAPRAAIYLRISDDREGLAVGVTRQRTDCRALAADHAASVVVEFCDDDIGASTRSRKRRPDFADMIARAVAGEFDLIVCYSSSRLTRRPRENEDLIELAERHGIRFLYVRSPSFDLNTADGRNVARILAANDAAEAERTGERVQRAALTRATEGRDHGGERRYGFACQCPGPHDIRKMQPNGDVKIRRHEHADPATIAAEVEIVRELTRRIVDSESCRGLARDLRERGISAARGGDWSARVVKEIVLRPRNAGYVEHQGAILHDADGVPVRRTDPETGEPETPIVDPDEWDAARAILTDPARGEWRGQTPTSQLAGIGTCHCGGSIRSGSNDKYIGGECNHLKRSRRHVDEKVNQTIVSLLNQDDVKIRTSADPTSVDNSAKLAAVRRQLTQLEDRLSDEDLSLAAYRRQRTRKLAQLAELERQEALSRVPDELMGVTAENFIGLPLERRRAVVRTLVVVRLLPNTRRGSRFDPITVEVMPREGTLATVSA
jgi:site-specific DNA recombinase